MGQTLAHSHCLTPSLLPYPSSFIPLSAMQCRTMRRRRTRVEAPDRAGNTMTLQRPGEWNPPPQWDMCHSPAASPNLYCGLAWLSCGPLSPPLPSAVGSPACVSLSWSLAALSPFCPACRSRFTPDTSVFYICDRYQSSSVLRRNALEIRSWPLRPRPPGENSILF